MSLGFFRSTSTAMRRVLCAAFLVALAGLFTAATVSDGYARIGGGGTFGSRGSRSYSAPPSTYTAPRTSPLSSSPSYGSSFAPRPGLFSGGGFGRGLLGGLVGAGLFGLLLGNGFGGGLGGGSSFIGLILQLGLLYLAFRFITGLFRGRQPMFGGAGFGGGGQAGPAPSGSGSVGPRGPQGVPITIEPADYESFERRLAEIQAVYSAENTEALQRLATPEMARHFADELAGNARQGVVNQLSNVKLLRGDLSEAWREGSTDYATVAMRFSLVDIVVERNSGRIVSGSAATPEVVTELWTFARPAGSGQHDWVLSAIQQT